MKVMKRGALWDIIAWIILAAILLWILLKVLGIINTPLWLEYSLLLGAVYLAGWAMHKLETATGNIEEIKKFNKATAEQINIIKSNCLKNHF